MKSNQLAPALASCLLLLTTIKGGAQVAAPDKSGLAVGTKAPAFALKDQRGRDISLESLLKKGPVALLFFRSANW